MANKINTTVFTIEQVDLIRRLRRTGIPLDKLIYAYREMDRLERETCQIPAKSNCNSLNNSFNNFNNSVNHGNNNNINHANNSVLNQQQMQMDQINLSSDSINSYDPNMSNNFSIASQPSTSKLQSMGLSSFADEHSELLEFKKKGESAILMEIRSFVAKYNIRQNMLAEMTGISQGYISRFFRGEGQDISDRAKNLIYGWYLNFRRNPTKILQCCPMTVGDRKMISETGDLLPIRRDRFIFRKQHLQVLEQYFSENPYPDSHTKEQIAEECNIAAERISTRPLSDKDRVTTSIVSNWFNNKRKDMKMSRHLQGKFLLMAAAHQQQNSDSNSSLIENATNANTNNLSNNSNQQQNNEGQNGQQRTPGQNNQPNQSNNSNYYYRDTQPLKLETYPDLPLQCYQNMDEDESEPDVD